MYLTKTSLRRKLARFVHRGVARVGGTKIVLVMNFTGIFLLAGALQVAAAGSAQTVTYSAKSASLQQVFTEIMKQTGVKFFYEDSDLEKTGPVTVKLVNAGLKDALEKILPAKFFEFQILGNTVFITKREIKKVSPIIINDSPPVKGIVRDADGNPISGVNILVKGTKKGARTGLDGSFSLNINAGDILIISSIGFETREYKINEETTFDIVLQVRKTALDTAEVVINTGYQSVSKERVVGSVSTLDSTSYHRRAGMNIIDRLDGTIPGLVVNRKGGKQIITRGISSLNGNSLSPLIILDNFPFTGDLNNINPNDILNITVLKDAAATSIWGARGGNGVIVITTKKARFDSGLSVALSSNISIQKKPDLFYFRRLSPNDIIDIEEYLFNQGYYDNALTNNYDRPIVSPVVETLEKKRQGLLTGEQAGELIDNYRKHDLRNDLTNYIYRDKISQQHHLSINGGSGVALYNFSFGFNPNTADIKGTEGSKQYTLNLNNSFKPVKNLEIETGIQFTTASDKSASLGSVAVDFPTTMYPYARLVDDAGNSMEIPKSIRKSFTDTAGGGKLLNWGYNPIEEIKNTNTSKKVDFTRVNAGLGYKFTSWLSADIKYQYIKESRVDRDIYGAESFYARNLVNLFTQISETGEVNRVIPAGGILKEQIARSESQNIRGQLNFNKSWSSLHYLNALVAGELFSSRGNASLNTLFGYDDATGSYVSSLDYSKEYPIYANLMSSSRVPMDNGVRFLPVTKFVSLLANASYTYNNKYTLYASMRRDGANIFGVNTNNRWKPLWSVGGNWDILKEGFIHSPWISSLKLKIAYGYSGNVDNTRSGLATILYLYPSSFTNYMTAMVGDAPNPDLRWEQVNTLNLGTDFSLFSNRISGSLEFFNKRSTDLVAPTPVDISTGVSNYYVNIASLKGKGYDLVLNSRNLAGKFNWNTTISVSYNKTTVTKYINGGFMTSQFIGYGINPREGEIAYGLSSYKWAGLDPLTGDPQGLLNKTTSKDYYGIANDSLQNQVFHGSSLPLYTGFLFNSFNWKNFTFSFNITGRFKFFYRKPSINYSNLLTNWQGHPDYLDRWRAPGDESKTSIPSMIYPADIYRDQFFAFSEVNVKRGDNIRIQDARLQYSFNTANGRKLPFKRADVFVYANSLNLIIWRKDTAGNDPDFPELEIPPSKILTMGINIIF